MTWGSSNLVRARQAKRLASGYNGDVADSDLKARAGEIAQAVLDGLNRHTTSDEFLRNRYRYLNPKASDDTIEMLVRADGVAGHPREFLTIEQARTILESK